MNRAAQCLENSLWVSEYFDEVSVMSLAPLWCDWTAISAAYFLCHKPLSKTNWVFPVGENAPTQTISWCVLHVWKGSWPYSLGPVQSSYENMAYFITFHSVSPSLHRGFRPFSEQLQNLHLVQCLPIKTHTYLQIEVMQYRIFILIIFSFATQTTLSLWKKNKKRRQECKHTT